MQIRLLILTLAVGLFFYQEAFSTVTLSTSIVRFIGIDTSVAGGKILNTGGEIVVEAGVCYSKSINPTVFDKVVERKYPTDSFSCTLKNLDPQQIYYVRSYAVTASGFHYGPQQIFATEKIIWGEFTHGGYLFYILQPGDPGYVNGEFHGLVYINSEEINGNNSWGNGVDTFLNITDSSMFTGRENTNKIVAALGNGNYAAKYCYDLVKNGYDDWYMPSALEVQCLANSKLGVYFGLSSTEIDGKNATYVARTRKYAFLKTKKTRITVIRQF